MMNFKTGDVVRCIDNKSVELFLCEGEIYVVKDVNQFIVSGDNVQKVYLQSVDGSWLASRFTLESPVKADEEFPMYMSGDDEIDAMLRKCIETLSTKGVEYTGSSPDRLNNFREIGEDVGVPMEKAWYTYFNKHLRALQSYIKNGCEIKSNESIHGRIMDMITYLLLFEKLVLEIERNRAKK